MKANWKAVVESVFEPFTKASGRVDLLPLLTTEDLPKEVKQLQFKRFKTSKLLGVNAAHLPGGGFLCLYEHTDGRYLAFTLPTLNEADEKSVYDWGDSLGLVQEDLDASSFLFLCHELKGYFLTKSYYRKKDEALNIIDVVNDRYNGHSFDDLISFYEYVYVFKISEENPFYNEGISYFGFKLSSSFSGARSPIITKEINEAVSMLGTYKAISKDNLFQALTSTQWRHFFIEIYRCLESIYYFPWVLELRDKGNLDVPIAALKAHCRLTLNWREREEPSIMKIFAVVAPDDETILLENSIKIFKKHTKNKTFKRDSIGKEIYHIRNSLVHHEDYKNPDKIVMSGKEWEEVALYLTRILLKFTSDHAHEFA